MALLLPPPPGGFPPSLSPAIFSSGSRTNPGPITSPREPGQNGGWAPEAGEVAAWQPLPSLAPNSPSHQRTSWQPRWLVHGPHRQGLPSPRVGWVQGLGGLTPTSCSLAPALQRPLAALWSLPAPTQPSQRGGPGAGAPAAESFSGSFKALGGQPCGYIPRTGGVRGGQDGGIRGPSASVYSPLHCLPGWAPGKGPDTLLAPDPVLGPGCLGWRCPGGVCCVWGPSGLTLECSPPRETSGTKVGGTPPGLLRALAELRGCCGQPFLSPPSPLPSRPTFLSEAGAAGRGGDRGKKGLPV